MAALAARDIAADGIDGLNASSVFEEADPGECWFMEEVLPGSTSVIMSSKDQHGLIVFEEREISQGDDVRPLGGIALGKYRHPRNHLGPGKIHKLLHAI